MRLNDEQKQNLVMLYQSGESATDICIKEGVLKNTFYSWVKMYTSQTTRSGLEVNVNEFFKMK